jgi:cell division protein FtsI (penicillin-binding protein 3)
MNPITPKDRKRLLAVGFLLLLLFCGLILRYYQIQITEGEEWSRLARRQHYFIVKEPFTRGTFYASSKGKKGHPEKEQKLVVDIEKFHLHIDPESFPEKNKKEISSVLSRLLDIPKEENESFERQFYVKSRSRKLAMWLDPEHKSVILEWWNVFARKNKIPRNALFFVSDYKRSYPFGPLLGQVLHTVQDIKEEATHQACPTGGLELYCNQHLKGKLGKQRLMRSPRNSIETGDVIAYPENGADVYLTIDLTLQSIAEEELEKGVKKCKAKCGWAVMMDPHSGEILALAQYPFFYPGDYQKYFNDPELIQHTKVKAATDANEIGSVMKPITVACALLANEELEKRGEKPLFSPDEKISCASGKFPGRSKPITDTHSHAFLNMNMAIQKSSNIYVARLVERIVERLGSPWYRNVLKDVFGFSLKTGIELPSESPGILPTPGKFHPNGTLEWSTPTPFSMAFGHNLQATSIQMLRVSSVIANGGYLVKPTIIRKIVKKEEDGSETIVFEPEKQMKQVLSKDITDLITRGMKFATKLGGTCRRGDVAGYTEAGKTSTSKKIVNGAYSEKFYIGSFIGFTPVKDPAFILLVTMDEPEYGYIQGVGKNHNGGACASTVFKEVARRSLAYLGIAPDDPHGYPPGDPRYDPEKADWVAENKRLNELYKKWNN